MYKKNKLRLNQIASAMQGFYVLVKVDLVIIYILKVYCKNSSSTLLRQNMFNSLLAFFFWKVCTFSSFERFLYWKSRNYSQYFSHEIFVWDLFTRITNYWGSIFTLYITWGAFSLVCVLSYFFFSFFLSFFFVFFCCRYFSWQTLTIHRITGKGEEVLIFLFFHFHPFTNIHLVHRDFYHFCLIDLFVITRLIADKTCSPCWFAFYLYFRWCN